MKYRQIYYQVQQPDYGFTAQTSLDTATASDPITLAKSPLADLVTSAYVFAMSASGFLGTNVTAPAAAPTLGGLATTLSVSPGQLLAANEDLATNAVFAGPIQIPHFHVVAHGDSLYSIAGNDETKAVALGEQAQNLPAPLAAMAVLTTKAWTQALGANGSDHNLSFQQIATLANCTVAGLAAANATAPIIAKGVTLSYAASRTRPRRSRR